MARLYRFHCLGDRGEAELDPRGCWLPSMTAVRAHADKVALALMARVSRLDWTRWTVDVRDTKGRRVMLRRFTEVRGARRSA